MKALVFHKPKDVRVETVADPKIEDPRDAIVRVTATAICGSDLHIYNGMFPQLQPLVLGHEFMGVVEEVGRDVQRLTRGDRVVVPFPIACGGCWFCEHGLPTQCETSNPDHYGPEGGLLDGKGGGLFGYTSLYGGYAGGQAELVRVPFADYGPRKVSADLNDEQVLFLTDILPTGYCGIEWANLKPGETVAVFGCGPVGLMAQKVAWLKGAGRVIGVDWVPERLAMAKAAAKSEVIDFKGVDPVERIREMTGGRGADVCVDAVGMEADRSILERVSNAIHLERGTMKVVEQCTRAVRRGGRITIMGVYGTTFDNFPLGRLLDKGITLRSGQALVHEHIDHLLELIQSGKLRVDDIITHRLSLDDAARGYDIFNAKEDGCVKVVLKP